MAVLDTVSRGGLNRIPPCPGRLVPLVCHSPGRGARRGGADQLLQRGFQVRAAAGPADLIEEEADAPRLNAEVARQTDPRRLIATGVHLTRQLNECCGDILEVLFSAASAEPDAAALVAEGMRRHDQGASQAARRLAALGALAPDTTPEQAAAVFSMMASPASWRQLTQHSGWSFSQAETWLTASLTQLLLEGSR